MKTKFGFGKKSLKSIFKTTAISICLSVAVSACTPRISAHGNYPREEQIEKIVAGNANKKFVFETYGPPSTVSSFDSETWYYISQKFERFAFYEPEIIEMNILAVYFDDKGMFINSNEYNLEDLRKLALEEKTTPTAGHELSFIQQMFGNFGVLN